MILVVRRMPGGNPRRDCAGEGEFAVGACSKKTAALEARRLGENALYCPK